MYVVAAGARWQAGRWLAVAAEAGQRRAAGGRQAGGIAKRLSPVQHRAN